MTASNSWNQVPRDHRKSKTEQIEKTNPMKNWKVKTWDEERKEQWRGRTSPTTTTTTRRRRGRRQQKNHGGKERILQSFLSFSPPFLRVTLRDVNYRAIWRRRRRTDGTRRSIYRSSKIVPRIECYVFASLVHREVAAHREGIYTRMSILSRARTHVHTFAHFPPPKLRIQSYKPLDTC